MPRSPRTLALRRPSAGCPRAAAPLQRSRPSCSWACWKNLSAATPLDNAAAEAVNSTLKTEYVHRRSFATREQDRLEIGRWIDRFYNTRRGHSWCGIRGMTDPPHQTRWTATTLVANITGVVVPSRRERTHARLIECALDLFEAQGFEQATVAQIAAAAGVTEMTFFRHFASKELVVTTDPYDPEVAAGIAAQPIGDPVLARAVRGVRDAFRMVSEPDTEVVRRRVRIIADSPVLRASSARGNEATEKRIGDQLIADGAPALASRAAAAALMAALTTALYEWARDERLSLGDAIDVALRTLESSDA